MKDAPDRSQIEPVELASEFDVAARPHGRRAFFGIAAIGTLGIVLGKTVARGITTVAEPVARRDPTGILEQLPISDSRWTIFTVTGGYPKRSRDDYRLRVDGLVNTPLDLSYDALRSLRSTRLTKDFQCVTGWRVPDVPWVGVTLRDLLAEAGVQAGATALRFYSFDGEYTESLTLEQAQRDDMIVAYEMLGREITTEHGGPVRLYAAPMYGYKSLKWLERIEVVDNVIPGYWEDRGYDVDAWVGASNGLSDDPT